jgi:hypothetical protein
MKTGDIIHVPAGITLCRETPSPQGSNYRNFVMYTTTISKKALFIKDLGHQYDQCNIEYGEHTWVAYYKDIGLVE